MFEAWRSFPFAFLFLTARIQAIPGSLEEAALVDGATPTQTFRHIVLPQLLPTIAVLTVLRFIWTFNNFDDIYLLTGGGSGTQVVAVRVYDYLINRGDIGAAAAMALVLAAILAILVGAYLKLFGRQEEVA
jgi:multiple sugar transport system permease protein